jgi:N utilization substance protein A
LKSEFVMAINQICSERNLPQEVIYEAIESALVSAYKRNYGSGPNIKAAIDFGTGTPHVYEERIVAEEIEDERFEISLREARRIDPEAELGSLVRKEVTPRSFGRIAAQTARQVILQRIREAERDALFSSYADREGELINGMVASITSQAITLNLGRTEAVMPRNQQVPGERYRIGQRIRAYVMEVRRTSRGPQIVVSRTHRHMLRRLLELEVPEIFNGTVEIKSIAREAGTRSKVAVTALQDGVDPVGSCVGIRGMRIQSIVNELGGEKIDVVEWSPDTATFIANALSPAKVSYVVLGSPTANGKTATVVVPDDQLSLAIGKEGQNARLGAKLTGWRIDIKSASEAGKEDLKPGEYAPPVPAKERDILAMAEAILLGKQPEAVEPEPAVEEVVAEATPEPGEELVSEPEAVPAIAEAEPQPVGPPVSVLAAAEALLGETEPAEEAVEVASAEVAVEEAEATAPEAPVAVAEPEAGAEAAAEPEAEAETAPEPEPATEEVAAPVEEKAPAPQQRDRTRYRYVEDEQLEAVISGDGRGPQRKSRRRELVLDEDSGQLISRRRHKKHGDDEFDWEDVDY